jgi:hypothetical protein
MAQAGRLGVALDSIFLTIATLYDYGFGAVLAQRLVSRPAVAHRARWRDVARAYAGAGCLACHCAALRCSPFNRASRRAMVRFQPGRY